MDLHDGSANYYVICDGKKKIVLLDLTWKDYLESSYSTLLDMIYKKIHLFFTGMTRIILGLHY